MDQLVQEDGCLLFGVVCAEDGDVGEEGDESVGELRSDVGEVVVESADEDESGGVELREVGADEELVDDDRDGVVDLGEVQQDALFFEQREVLGLVDACLLEGEGVVRLEEHRLGHFESVSEDCLEFLLVRVAELDAFLDVVRVELREEVVLLLEGAAADRSAVFDVLVEGDVSQRLVEVHFDDDFFLGDLMVLRFPSLVRGRAPLCVVRGTRGPDRASL